MRNVSLIPCAVVLALTVHSLAAFGAVGDPPMPEAVTSFGATTNDGWLYSFGGHLGKRHEYNAEMVSGSLHRLRLDGSGEWERMPSSAPGQGVALVAHDGVLYRIGGMAARNGSETESDLFSETIVERIAPPHGKWEAMAPLPAGRSSHDAVVVGDKLYVVGGWQLVGKSTKPVWHSESLVLDLARPKLGWKPIPQPFQRRAVAVAALGSRVFCMGGMDSDNEPSLAVEIYDSVTEEWTHGPELPRGRHRGFSCSAIAQGGRIYVNMFQGDLLRLAEDGTSWEVVGRLEHPRLAHRLVAAGGNQLIAFGGEDGEEKRPDLERLTPTEPVGDEGE